MKKLRVGILFGGRSGEYEVSLLSAASVLNAIDKKKYEVVPIGITKEGRRLTAEYSENLLQGKLVIEPHHLRAGDSETTPAAAVLAGRISHSSARASTSSKWPDALPERRRAHAPRQRPRHQCGCALPYASRHVWTKRNLRPINGVRRS